jgi:hypothetical protein
MRQFSNGSTGKKPVLVTNSHGPGLVSEKCRRSEHWIKIKNPAAPAVRRLELGAGGKPMGSRVLYKWTTS